MNDLLLEANGTVEVPDDAYRICCIGTNYNYLKRQDYNLFCNLWISHFGKLPLTMQLYSTPHHSLFFDIDFIEKKPDTSEPSESTLNIFSPVHRHNLLDTFETNLKMHFFPHVHDFTIIYALRPGSHGVHVHLPEFTIANDDYVEFCKQLQSSSILPDGGPYHLDVPLNWSFPGVGKPANPDYYYFPTIVKYITEDETLSFDIKNFLPVNVDQISKKFRRIKKNSDSFFRKLLTVKPDQLKKYLFQLMFPIVIGFKPRYKISYATNISDNPALEDDTYDNVAALSFHYEGRMGYVLKSKTLSFDPSNFLRLFQYFQYRAVAIKSIETENSAMNNWYNMFAVASRDDEQSLFGKINLELRLDNPIFLHDRNPLETVLKYDNGYFFLPVFFALTKYLNLSAADLVFHLRPMLITPEFRDLLSRLENLNEEYVKSIANELTLNTIFFCAHNMRDSPEEPKTFQEKLTNIVKKSKNLILGVCSTAQMSELLLKIQERYFPIKMIVQSNMTGLKTTTYVWNALKHSWKEINTEKERYDHVINLWTTIKNFLHEYRNSGGIGGPDLDVIDKLSLSSVVSTQSSNKSMEQEKAAMDAHKWFIRLANGCMIDLLTGHIGAVVPEFYMSSRTVNIDIPRPKLVEYLNQTSLLKKMHDLLVDQQFFTRFLKQLLLDETDEIYDTASEVVSKALMTIEWENDKYAKSMLRFFIHLCKFVAFEYDVLMYLLDVLASTMIATNYKRKFFVCKGETNNGKSMLFEIVGRMFGQYYSSILSDNLQKSKSNANAAPSPDLALTLFTCRVVAMEELESNFSENRIKQITGLSRVAFRSLFTVSQSAVPTAKVFVTTNNVPDCLVSQAFRERVVAFPFNSTFVEKAPTKTSERVLQCLYPKEEYVIEKSYEGCFFLLYFHFRNCVKIEDGLIHYREEPISVVEFTQDYLRNTDVYIQFKCHMDVQIVLGSMTTMTDLETAIRDFLKEKKAPVSCATEIKIKFEREFKEYRRIDDMQSSYCFNGIFNTQNESSAMFLDQNLLEEDEDSSDDNEDENEEPKDDGTSLKRKSKTENENVPPKKKRNISKQHNLENAAVLYENVMIKRLKKSSVFEN